MGWAIYIHLLFNVWQGLDRASRRAPGEDLAKITRAWGFFAPEVEIGRRPGSDVDIHLPSGDLADLLTHPLVRGLLEFSSDGAVVIDAETRRVLAMNGRARALLGIEGEVDGRCCHEALDSPACQHACPLTRAEQGLLHPDVTTLFFRRHDDRSVVQAEARVLVIRDASGNPLAAIELISDRRQVQALERALRARRTVLGLVGRSAPMQALYEQVELLGPCDLPVLVTGAPGAGKRRVAEALHAASPRSGGALVTVEAATTPGSMQGEALLRGVEAARGGSLLLVGVDDLEPGLVRALVAAVTEGRLCWGTSVRSLAETRLLLTAARPPATLAAALAQATVRVPALAERIDDLPLLVADLLAGGPGPSRIEPEALALLARRPWPGNVGELARMLSAAAVRAGGRTVLTAEDFGVLEGVEPATTRLADIEEATIRRAMERTEGNLSAAARELGIDRSTLWRKLKRLEREGAAP